MVAVKRWSEKQIEAQNLIRALGSTEQQRQILGDDYAWIVGTVAGTSTPPPLPLPQTEDDTSAPKRPSDGVEGPAKKLRLS